MIAPCIQQMFENILKGGYYLLTEKQVSGQRFRKIFQPTSKQFYTEREIKQRLFGHFYIIGSARRYANDKHSFLNPFNFVLAKINVKNGIAGKVALVQRALVEIGSYAEESMEELRVGDVRVEPKHVPTALSVCETTLKDAKDLLENQKYLKQLQKKFKPPQEQKSGKKTFGKTLTHFVQFANSGSLYVASQFSPKPNMEFVPSPFAKKAERNELMLLKDDPFSRTLKEMHEGIEDADNKRNTEQISKSRTKELTEVKLTHMYPQELDLK